MGSAKPDEDAVKPVHSPIPIRLTSALDHYAIVADIFLDRAEKISTNPAREVVLPAVPEPVLEDENLQRLKDMKLLADAMQVKTKYGQIICLTVRDDADDPVRDKATRELRSHVEEIGKAGTTALVVPLLLSYGGTENGLRDRLKGLVYKMTTQGLLPDPRIPAWVFLRKSMPLQMVSNRRRVTDTELRLHDSFGRS
jgi:hypothetical protein